MNEKAVSSILSTLEKGLKVIIYTLSDVQQSLRYFADAAASESAHTEAQNAPQQLALDLPLSEPAPCDGDATEAHGGPQNECNAADSVGCENGADAGEAGAAENSERGFEKLRGDNPLREEHLLVRQKKSSAPLGNFALAAFLEECCTPGGRTPINDLYIALAAFCERNNLKQATQRGVRYLLHRNGIAIEQSFSAQHQRTYVCGYTLKG